MGPGPQTRTKFLCPEAGTPEARFLQDMAITSTGGNILILLRRTGNPSFQEQTCEGRNKIFMRFYRKALLRRQLQIANEIDTHITCQKKDIITLQQSQCHRTLAYRGIVQLYRWRRGSPRHPLDLHIEVGTQLRSFILVDSGASTSLLHATIILCHADERGQPWSDISNDHLCSEQGCTRFDCLLSKSFRYLSHCLPLAVFPIQRGRCH